MTNEYPLKLQDRLKVLIAPNTFKESVTALEVCQAMQQGILTACPNAEVIYVPVADGGDGTIQALVDATGGSIETVPVHDPLGRPVQAPIGCLGDGKTYAIEMAQASGLWMLRPEERNPYLTSTYGTGELILATLQRGAKRILVGIGGSATNDGGAGLACALGFRLLDRHGKKLDGTGGCLNDIVSIDSSQADPRIIKTEIIVMCDVDNPLCGPHGASKIYGPQKGATPEMVEKLDDGLHRLAEIVHRDLGASILRLPGSGAAGGLGGGLVAFTGGRLKPGFQAVANAVGLHRHLKDVDLLFTGEGRLDGSTVYGKVPAGVAQLGAKHGIPVIALAGSLVHGWQVLLERGLSAAFSIVPGPCTLSDAMEQASTWIAATTRQAMLLFLAGKIGAREIAG